MKKRINKEQYFNEYFKNRKKSGYNFDSKKLGIRDRAIKKELLGLKIKNKRCLDIGPGTGRWLRFLKYQEPEFLAGIDISSESIELYKNFCDKTQKVDIENEKLNFDDNYFDIIVSFMVLEHLIDPDNFFNEIHRIVKKDGRVLITIPNIVSFKSRLKVLFGVLPPAVTSDISHVRFYNIGAIKELVSNYGFNVSFIPTSFSIHPKKDGKLNIKSNSILNSLDDDLLFKLTK